MSFIASILGILISPITKLFSAFMVYRAGKNSVQKDILEKNNAILKEQRDNDVTNISDADKLSDKYSNNS